jgi:hypothetical protein
MSTENKRKPRRAAGAGLTARQARAASTSAETLALILAELQQLRMELKSRDAFYESSGVPVRLLADEIEL